MAEPPIIPAYQAPVADRRNTPLKFILRMAVGLTFGLIAYAAGIVITIFTHSKILFFIPAAIVFSIAIFIAVHKHRYGYVTGMLLTPFVAGILILLFLIIAFNLPHGT